ncbi:MAG: NPCBM/NEW2 domain-containing protein [Clostridiales bacterium]|nr:NPCBM/NEW2 domain-containing protein [Clostridiales bacterium]
MKFSLKRFMVFPAAILALSLPAVAKQAVETAELTFKNISVYADGQLVDTTGAEPFIYNGTTYLPVRAVAEALGKEVNWVGETSTVYLGAMPSAFVETDTLLEDMYSYNSTFSKVEHINKGADNKSNSYTSGCVFNCSSTGKTNENSAEYSLNGKYSSLKGVIAVPYVERNVQKTRVVKFYGDGELIYTSAELAKDSEPEPFELDLSDISVLKIQIEGSANVGIYDAMFYAK